MDIQQLWDRHLIYSVVVSKILKYVVKNIWDIKAEYLDITTEYMKW